VKTATLNQNLSVRGILRGKKSVRADSEGVETESIRPKGVEGEKGAVPKPSALFWAWHRGRSRTEVVLIREGGKLTVFHVPDEGALKQGKKSLKTSPKGD